MPVFRVIILIMKILITGGSGFIGSHLIEELFEAGHTVASLDWREASDKVAGVEYILLDFAKHEELLKVFQRWQPDSICHLGAVPSVQTSIRTPFESLYSNSTGLYSVLETSRIAGVRRFIFASSAAVYCTTGQKY